MALTSKAVADNVFTSYLSKYPTAVNARRSNSLAVPPVLEHVIPEAMVSALSEGLVTTISSLLIKDPLVGTAGTLAEAEKAAISFPTASTEATALRLALGWTGAEASKILDILVVDMFTAVSSNGHLLMNPIPVGVGGGTGAVTVISNPLLEETAASSLATTLPEAFKASGKFFKNDDPDSGLPTELLTMLSNLAATYAAILGNISAAVIYTGVLTTGAVTVSNTGRIQ